MTKIELRVTEPSEAQAAASTMHDALNIPDRLWKLIADPQYATYTAYAGDDPVAAAIVRWADVSEIEVFAVDRCRRRQGLGQAVIAEIVREAKKRGVCTILVGTSSIALDNIMFYQKCGFRMYQVRRNYFAESFPDLHVEWRGVVLRDMIVFAYDLTDD